MSKRLLVTGALGNVGKEVVAACSQTDLIVRAADRRHGPVSQTSARQETVELDFLRSATWEPALRDCDYVFLLRPPPIGDMNATLIPFLSAAYAAGVEHVLFLSVARADEMKWVPHRKVELWLEQSGKPWTVLRPGFFAQNLESAYRRDIVEDGRLYVPAADGRIAFLDVRDIGDVAAHILQAPAPFIGRALTLTGPESLTFQQVAAMLTSELGRLIVYEPATIPGYVWHLRGHRDMPWTQIAIQTVLHTGLRRGDAEAVEGTISQLLKRPARGMLEYIQRAKSAWR